MLRTAYNFLKYDKAKSIGVIIGIVICIFLIGQQIGILTFLMGLMSGLIDNSDTRNAQIWVVDKITINANELARLDESLVREVRSVEGVKNSYPLILTQAIATFSTGKTAPVNLVGSDPPNFIAGPNPEKIGKGNIFDLVQDDAISADFYDASTFANPTDIDTELEINGKRAQIRLQTKDARGFGGSYLYTTLSKARFYGNFPEDKVSAIAVSIKEGYSADVVRDNINKALPSIRAWKTEDLKSSTVRFIVVSSNIGTSIGSLVIFAIISGFFIIGLTLYSSAIDRVKDYGTLKAIGATNSYITKLILTQSLITATLGFCIAWLLLEGFRSGVANAGLLFRLSPLLLGGLYILTFIISTGSALFFSIRTISNVEPASVFRN
jgi:putative ABC transport system permease protein